MNNHHEAIALAEHHRAQLLADAAATRRRGHRRWMGRRRHTV
jgi:hypothetical protein